MQKSLQNAFLDAARHERIPVTVFLVNGVRMTAVVKGHDPFVVVLDVGGHQQMVYKHAISTMIPETTLDVRIEDA